MDSEKVTKISYTIGLILLFSSIFLINLIARINPWLWVIFVIIGILITIIGVFSGYIWSSRGNFRKKYLLSVLIIFLLLTVVVIRINRQREAQFSYIEINGENRQFIMLEPDNIDQNQLYPLLLALHGGSGSAIQFKDNTEIESLVSESFVVFPDGTGRFEYSLHTWNSGYIGNQEVDDVQFLFILIQHLIENEQVDPSRVYMIGHSNGAMMTYRYAAEHPETLAGIVAVSGSVGGYQDGESQYTIPIPTEGERVFHIHGIYDTNVNYNGGISEGGWESGNRYDVGAIESINFWYMINNCGGESLIFNQDTMTVIEYTGCNFETSLTSLDAEHDWEGLNNAIAETEEWDSLAKYIWEILTL